MVNYLLSIVLIISFNVIVFVNGLPSCYKCNSATDDNCKIFQADLLTVNECEKDFDPDDPDAINVCYTIFDGSNVVRNCLTDQTVEFRTECENNPNCHPCNTDNCNTVNFEPLQCIKCNSILDENCATVRQSITATEQCENLDEQCFVGVSDGITYRGCIASTGSSIECPPGVCEKCLNKDKCNDAIYPVDRLSCHQCHGHVNCNGEQDPTASYICRNSTIDDRCYVYGMGLYAERGCISDTDEYSQYCLDNPNLCISCNSEAGCNGQNAVVVNTEKSCYFCDQTSDYCFAHVESADPTISSECKLFLNYEFKCYTYRSGDNITRGCLNHIEGHSPPECINNDEGSCHICDKDLCNSHKELATGDSCISCTMDDLGCNNAENILSFTELCYSHPDKQGCYFRPGQGRGCATNLPDDILVECQSNSDSCKICIGENCNQKLGFTTCYECDSTEDDKCVDGGTDSKICYDYLDTCVVYVEEHGRTVRGCTNALNPTCSSWNCSECHTNDCNVAMFPDDRLKCLKCSSDADLHCFEISELSEATHSATCQNFVSDDYCFTIVNGDHNLTRGCISDQNAAAIECSNEEKYCVRCPRSNCNGRELKYEPTLACIQCKQTDPKCAWGFHENDAQPCNTTLFFDDQELCYTYQKDGEISRGCTLDDEKCLDNDAACTTCGTHGCNSRHLTQSDCIVCDSTDIEEEFCNSEIEDGVLTTCSIVNQLYERRGCYTFKTDTHVHRGCVSMLTDDQFAYCQNADNINCDICYGEGCNNQEPNYASRLFYLSTLNLICISLLAKLLN